MDTCNDSPFLLILIHSPEYIMVLMHTVQLQLKARQQVHYHDP